MTVPAVITNMCRAFARFVFVGDMAYFDAEYHIATLSPRFGFEDIDAAFDLFAKFLDRYEKETVRLSSDIRRTSRLMMDRRAKPAEIKQSAATMNKQNFLSELEITEILRSEYLAWKSTTTTHPQTNISVQAPK